MNLGETLSAADPTADATTLAEWFRRRATRAPDRPALSFEGQTWRYGALQDEIEQLSAVLVAGGLRAGERLAWLGFNDPLQIVALFAAARIGAIFVPLNFRLSAPELKSIIDDAGVHTVIADATHAPLLDSIRESLCCQRYLGLGMVSADWLALATERDAGYPIPVAVNSRPEDVVLLLYTSGTTGRPKGVMISSRNIWTGNLNGLLSTDLNSRDVTLNCAPLFHAAALGVLVLPSLMAGAHLILQRSFDAAGLLSALAQYSVTLTMLVPAMMLMISQHTDFATADLSALRLVLAGGAPVPEPLLRTFATRRIAVSQCYGMTESTAIATLLDAEFAMSRLGSCGRPAALTDVCLVDREGARITEPHRPGEVWLRGGNIASGYWNRPEESAAAFRDGWFRSGDGATVDEQGFYTICDRLKDMIISGGENIYPAEIEGLLYEHSAIAEAAVIGAPDARWGERVLVIAVLKPGSCLDLDALRAFVEPRLARYKLPSELHVVDALPRSSTGKILKAELRKRFAGAGAS